MPENTDPGREYRYERKYYVDELDTRQAIALIKRHPALFSEIYPPRFINNIYFDSPLMENYSDNTDGAPERKKARIRWYHHLFRQVDDATLEFKIKNGLMGTKIQYTFPGFNFGKGFSQRDLECLIRNSALPRDVANYLLSGEPVLVNRYQRRYFATPDSHYRVTVDSDLSFFHLGRNNNQFLHRQTEQGSIVVELKYNKEHDSGASRVSSGFPFRMTRSSKYVRGIERVYL